MRAKSPDKNCDRRTKKAGRASEENRDGSQGPAYESRFAAIARVICRLGGSEVQLSEVFGTDESTIQSWVREHPDFRQACQCGVDAADERVTRSLFQRACGYWYNDVKVLRWRGRVIYASFRRHALPDVKAAIFWLSHRRAEQWSDKKVVGSSEKQGDGSMTQLLHELQEMRRNPPRS